MQKLAQQQQEKNDKRKERYRNLYQKRSIKRQEVHNEEAGKISKERLDIILADIRTKAEQEKKKNRRRSLFVGAAVFILMGIMVLFIKLLM